VGLFVKSMHLKARLLKAVCPLEKVSEIMPVTATPWAGQQIVSFLLFVVLPKVAKASTIVTVTCHSCWDFCLKNIVNVHKLN
jgi:hypothetical protein